MDVEISKSVTVADRGIARIFQKGATYSVQPETVRRLARVDALAESSLAGAISAGVLPKRTKDQPPVKRRGRPPKPKAVEPVAEKVEGDTSTVEPGDDQE
ncbi:hypothetical protein [Breoghania sp.]|uniref:hypothetical protein n=1 Tax=Breoghania sp. TaxID=2065378 RepID=UPI002AA8FD51|nr:hypothetical protein [Breoghania sp.]